MIKKPIIKITALLVIIGLNWTGLLAVGNTMSFFNDTEDSAENSLSAGTLDFSIPSISDFSPDALNPGGSATRDISINKATGSLDFQYKVSYQFISGSSDLCNALNLTVDGYNEPLNSFSDYGAPFEFFSTPSLNFVVTLPSDASDSLQGTNCQFKFVFAGWQDGTWGQGFNDTEEIVNNISANYWNPSVVLNEFLPNPKGEDNQTGLNGEWVELYNTTDDDINVNNWYIKNSQDNIVTITNSNTMSGDTIVPAYGWLVIYMNGEILDNISDNVDLYSNNDVQVDSYFYDASEHNVNNTPGWTNNLSAYFSLDNDTNDESGNGNNGISSSAVFSTGKINKGLSFDGNDNVTVNNSDSLKPNMVTLEAWVKSAGSPGTYKYIAGKHYNGSWASYALYTGSTGRIRFYIGYTGGYVLSPSASAVSVWDGEWHHIVGVFDGSKVLFYVDGAQVGAGTSTAQTIVYNNDDFYIGSYASGYYFDGMIDEVKVYGRALDDSEIQDHYSAVTFNGEVPENKSYARIPDGSINWVDPVPTPGEPNVLEEELTPLETEGETVSGVVLTDIDTVCLMPDEILESNDPEDDSVVETEDASEIQNEENEETEGSAEEIAVPEETVPTEETVVEETAPTEETVSEEDNMVQENDMIIDALESVDEEIQSPEVDEPAQNQDVIADETNNDSIQTDSNPEPAIEQNPVVGPESEPAMAPVDDNSSSGDPAAPAEGEDTGASDETST